MDSDARRHALRLMPHGLYIVATGHGQDAVANAITWVSQCSIKPPLVMAAIRTPGRLHDGIMANKAFTICIVGKDQQGMVANFFRPSVVEDNTINGYVFEPGPKTGAPLLLDCPAWFEGRVRDVITGGDHTVFIAELLQAGVRDETATALALSDTPWSYGG